MRATIFLVLCGVVLCQAQEPHYIEYVKTRDSDGGKIEIAEDSGCLDVVGKMSSSSMSDVLGCFVLYEGKGCTGKSEVVDYEVKASYTFNKVASVKKCPAAE